MKIARTVLRRGGASNRTSLFDPVLLVGDEELSAFLLPFAFISDDAANDLIEAIRNYKASYHNKSKQLRRFAKILFDEMIND